MVHEIVERDGVRGSSFPQTAKQTHLETVTARANTTRGNQAAWPRLPLRMLAR